MKILKSQTSLSFRYAEDLPSNRVQTFTISHIIPYEASLNLLKQIIKPLGNKDGLHGIRWHRLDNELGKGDLANEH